MLHSSWLKIHNDLKNRVTGWREGISNAVLLPADEIIHTTSTGGNGKGDADNVERILDEQCFMHGFVSYEEEPYEIRNELILMLDVATRPWRES